MAETVKFKLNVDMNVLADALKHLDDLEKQVRAQVTKFSELVLDLMAAKHYLMTVIGDLNTLKVG